MLELIGFKYRVTHSYIFVAGRSMGPYYKTDSEQLGFPFHLPEVCGPSVQCKGFMIFNCFVT